MPDLLAQELSTEAIRRYHSLRIAARLEAVVLLLETAEPFVFLSIGTTCRVCTYSEIGNSAGSRSANLGTSGTDSKTFAAFSRFLLSKSMSSNAKTLASWKYNSTGILRVSECGVSGSNSTCTTSRRGASWHH